ncbi:MAG: hypothetical protein MGAcid_10980 [uncultured Acidilobus sp. MG]|jgi:hypothetical protein|nr:MAG: hypothetical protein MGAcid_10980 [uncultured Acidilobus sp. MG]ESQ25305.1 MAG: hypothetical protein OSP8Acid_09630 [uncultured Acidilobus sp. OSP8]
MVYPPDVELYERLSADQPELSQ